MVEGQPEGHVVRSCYIGMTIGERIGLSEDLRSALFYALLLKDAGCSSNSFRTAVLFDADDFAAKRSFKTVDWSRLPNAVLYAARNVSPEGSVWAKARRFFSVGKVLPDVGRELIQIRCERGAEITRLMGFSEETAGAIRNLDEHWDGGGHPDGLKGDEIPFLARICGLAQTAEVFYSAYGPERAERVVRARRKRWFDPDLVDVFLAEARVGNIWENLRGDITGAISRMEPEDRSLLATPERLDLAAVAFAQIIDAKSPYTFQHSEGVADAAVAISAHMGLGPEELRNQRRAGLLHDIGKLGISNSILDKGSSLTDEEFAKIKTHPRLSYEILSRVPPFESIVDRAANHHEKLDGSGYPRGLTGEDLDLPSRILTVADIYDALAQDRPYRRAPPKERVMEIFDDESGTKLCPESVTALKELVSKGVL
ncbi:MAG TPA: HD domain-containing phosphohydrolase [Rubrobacteraceae bacterium]|nr:HD domain-containing phosphohydrolase [Rubrobacteraceae bacterium]